MKRTGPTNPIGWAAAAAAVLTLAACGSVNDGREDKLGNFLVAPGKYQLYDCAQLAQAATSYISRERELREVKAKAETAPGGLVISSLAYNAEYGQIQGNIEELRRETTEKKCEKPAPGLFDGRAPIAAPQGR